MYRSVCCGTFSSVYTYWDFRENLKKFREKATKIVPILKLLIIFRSNLMCMYGAYTKFDVSIFKKCRQQRSPQWTIHDCKGSYLTLSNEPIKHGNLCKL